MLKYSVWVKDPNTHTYTQASKPSNRRNTHWALYSKLVRSGKQARFVTENTRVDTPVLMRESGSSEWGQKTVKGQ